MYRSANPQVTIFACGGIVHTAVAAALDAADSVRALVVNVPTVKPLDGMVCQYAQESGVVLTVEEHQRIGGLGSAVAERLAEDCPMPVYRIGVDDVFGQSGTPEELLAHHHLTKEHIITMMRTAVSR